MTCSISAYRVGTALALTAAVVTSPARAAAVLLGSDYFQTAPPSFFVVPKGYPNADEVIQVKGLPIGPGTTDTIVQRQNNCILSLDFACPTRSCTIPIELVALSLVSVTDSNLRFREAPGSVPGISRSGGMMTMFSDGSGTGGTFDSFFGIYIEFSMNGGLSFAPYDLIPSTPTIDPLHLVQTGATWTTIEHGLLVDGLFGDQNANRHPEKSRCPSGFECPDFYLVGGGVVTETDVLATHTAQGAQGTVIPEPGSLALVSLALAAMAGLGGRGARRAGVRPEKAPSDSRCPV